MIPERNKKKFLYMSFIAEGGLMLQDIFPNVTALKEAITIGDAYLPDILVALMDPNKVTIFRLYVIINIPFKLISIQND